MKYLEMLYNTFSILHHRPLIYNVFYFISYVIKPKSIEGNLALTRGLKHLVNIDLEIRLLHYPCLISYPTRYQIFYAKGKFSNLGNRLMFHCDMKIMSQVDTILFYFLALSSVSCHITSDALKDMDPMGL